MPTFPLLIHIGNVSNVETPVMFTVSEFDLNSSLVGTAALINEYAEKSGQLPRFVQLMRHNHYSPNPSIGTQDTQLSASILQFVSSVIGGQELMTAR